MFPSSFFKCSSSNPCLFMNDLLQDIKADLRSLTNIISNDLFEDLCPATMLPESKINDYTDNELHLKMRLTSKDRQQNIDVFENVPDGPISPPVSLKVSHATNEKQTTQMELSGRNSENPLFEIEEQICNLQLRTEESDSTKSHDKLKKDIEKLTVEKEKLSHEVRKLTLDAEARKSKLNVLQRNNTILGEQVNVHKKISKLEADASRYENEIQKTIIKNLEQTVGLRGRIPQFHLAHRNEEKMEPIKQIIRPALLQYPTSNTSIPEDFPRPSLFNDKKRSNATHWVRGAVPKHFGSSFRTPQQIKSDKLLHKKRKES